MLVIKINDGEEAVKLFEEYLIGVDLVYTKNGTEFEIPSADVVGFLIGRNFEFIKNKVKNAIQLQEKEEIAQDSRGLKP